jgi:hypothetical protein
VLLGRLAGGIGQVLTRLNQIFRRRPNRKTPAEMRESPKYTMLPIVCATLSSAIGPTRIARLLC